MAGKGSTYKLREHSIAYNRYYNEWEVGRQHKFAYPQLADIFVYCWKTYGPSVAQEVAQDLKTKLDMTLAKYVRSSASAEIKSAAQDFLFGLAGAPSAPTPVAIGIKLAETAGTVIGEAYLKEKINMNKAWKNYTGDISPAYDVGTYCNYVLYSWFLDPVNGPYYRVG